MLVRDLVNAVKQLAPKAFAESWDKVGLLVGRTEAPLKGPVLLTIDLTERVLDEAQHSGVSAIISYHPPIWEPLARLTDESARQRIILRCAELGIAVYSPHTALDAAPGGVTDWLCEGLSGGNGKIAGDCRALTPHAKNDPTQEVKIVTFVPRDDVEKVRNALAAAGAGRIGGYQVCSFSTEGMGTFFKISIDSNACRNNFYFGIFKKKNLFYLLLNCHKTVQNSYAAQLVHRQSHFFFFD